MSFEKPGPVEDNWRDAISSVEEIIADARAGRVFILVDHEDRENEGDLVIPAQMATPEVVNFMATHGRGLICLALPGERIDALGLPLMSTNNSSRHETAFTVSIEAREGGRAPSRWRSTRARRRPTSPRRGTSSRFAPAPAAFSSAQATPRPRWTWRGSRVSTPRA